MGEPLEKPPSRATALAGTERPDARLEIEFEVEEGIFAKSVQTLRLDCHRNNAILYAWNISATDIITFLSPARRGGPWLGTMGLLRKAWQGWMRFAKILGTVQMVIFLSVIYWVMIPVIAIPFKLLSDPLTLRSSRHRGWIERRDFDKTLDGMKKQY